MDLQFEFERFRVEMTLLTRRLSEDLEIARGELLATNVALHAVIAVNPDRNRLGVALQEFEKQATRRLEGASSRYQRSYETTMFDLKVAMMDADASRPR